MKRYENYRPGSDRWFPDAPAEWVDRPIWTMFTRDARKGYADETLLSVYRDHGVVPKDSRDDNNNRPSEDLSTYQLVEPGDLVVNKMKAWQGSLSISTHRGIVSPAYFVYRPHHQADGRFLHHLLRSRPLIAAYIGMSKGVRVNQWDLEPQNFSRLKLALPPLDEQRAIADYLDRETARIDALIEEQGRLIELLQERRDAVTDMALARHGLKFPDRLEEYEGSLPGGWRLILLGRTLRQLTNGFVGPTRDILVDEGVRYIQSTHIKSGRIEFERRPFFVSREWHDARPRIHLSAGDVLIVQTGDIGKVAVVPEGFGEASCHALQIARVDPEIISGEYLGVFLSSRLGYQSLLSRATGALHPHLEAGIRSVPVVVPPMETQQRIVGEVAKETAKIDTLIAETERFIELARERRSALITAAVTGQIDVRAAA